MLNATLIEREDINEGLAIFRVKPDDGVSNFSPGQYLAIGLFPESKKMIDCPDKDDVKAGKIIRRSYSIASSPEQKEYYEFYIAIVPDGSLTARLACLRVGDRLHVAPKCVGKFTLDEIPESANLVFVSTGTGLAPFVSMLKTQGTIRENRKISILHGVRYPNDLAYKDYLRSLNINYYPVVSRAGEDFKDGYKGYVQHLFENGEVVLDVTKDHVMLCGNPAMVDTVEKLLHDKSFITHSKKTPGNLHVEKYW